jgi:hypothetical protein
MIKKSILPSLFLLLFISITTAQEATLAVDEMVFCTAIEDRQPTGTDSTFSNTVEQVYCFTKISGSVEETSITHVWYYENEEKARVQLSVKAKSWRTWSSKAIWKTWTGKWRVDVESSTGDVLMSKEFTIE